MEEQQKIGSNKLVTNAKYPGKTIADIALLNDGTLEPVSFDDYPKMTLIVAENEQKFKEGVVTLEITNSEFEHQPARYSVNMDVMIWVMRRVYARSINDLELQALRRARFIRFKKNLKYYIEEIKHFVAKIFE